MQDPNNYSSLDSHLAWEARSGMSPGSDGSQSLVFAASLALALEEGEGRWQGVVGWITKGVVNAQASNRFQRGQLGVGGGEWRVEDCRKSAATFKLPAFHFSHPCCLRRVRPLSKINTRRSSSFSPDKMEYLRNPTHSLPNTCILLSFL